MSFTDKVERRVRTNPKKWNGGHRYYLKDKCLVGTEEAHYIDVIWGYRAMGRDAAPEVRIIANFHIRDDDIDDISTNVKDFYEFSTWGDMVDVLQWLEDNTH